jgi:hypothetical protein
MNFEIPNLTLRLVERVEFVSKEGEKVSYFKCTFLDENRFPYVFNSTNESVIQAEGQTGTLILEFTQNTFGNKTENKVKLVDFRD